MTCGGGNRVASIIIATLGVYNNQIKTEEENTEVGGWDTDGMKPYNQLPSRFHPTKSLAAVVVFPNVLSRVH